MTVYSDLSQASAAVADPATAPGDLMAIAQAFPSLWAGIAKHPNAYSGLLFWLHENGDDAVRDAIAAREPSPDFPPPPPPPPQDGNEEASEESSPAEAEAHEDPESAIPADTDTSPVPKNPTPQATSPKLSWMSTPKGKKILIGSGAALLAIILSVVLIITLVVIPHKHAEEAAAAEQARLEQEHQTAVDAFTKASDACVQANQSLSEAISHAQQTAKTDPETLDDPTLIDDLNQAIAAAQALQLCKPPTMADDTATIQQQTADIDTTTKNLSDAASKLTAADQSVPASVQAKQEQEAAAKALALSDEDITTLLGSGKFPAGGDNLSSLIGQVANLGVPYSANDYGSSILPIFPIYGYGNNLVQAQPLSIDIQPSSILIRSISDSDQIDSNILYEYDADTSVLTIYYVEIFYRDSTVCYTKYQKATVIDVPASNWAKTVDIATQDKAQAEAYTTFMKNPDQKDAYGNPVTKPDYPTLNLETFTGLYGDYNVSSLWGSNEQVSARTFTSQTIIISPYSENIVGSLVATFTYARHDTWYDTGDFGDISVLSPKEITALGAEITAKCKWPASFTISSMKYPSTGTEDVRALNLAINSKKG